MAVTLKLRQALIVDGVVLAGDSNVNQAITLVTGQHYAVQEVVVADNYGEASLWTTPEGGLTTFTHGFILSDQDIWVQLRNDDVGAAEYVRLFVRANELTALPAKLGGGATGDAFDGAVLVDNTDYADVDKIEVSRDVADAVGDATVELHLFN